MNPTVQELIAEIERRRNQNQFSSVPAIVASSKYAGELPLRTTLYSQLIIAGFISSATELVTRQEDERRHLLSEVNNLREPYVLSYPFDDIAVMRDTLVQLGNHYNMRLNPDDFIKDYRKFPRNEDTRGYLIIAIHFLTCYNER